MAEIPENFENLTPEEKWERMTIANNYIFYYVMRNNPDICKEVIERLLQIEIDHIEMAQEETVNVNIESKSIRMDVYVKNSTQAFDLEMQANDTKELPERARYYQGIIDVDSLKSGEVYSKLKESYIIFICLSDIFKKGLPAYHFENLCTEDTSIKLNDKAYKYFFIAQNYAKLKDIKQKNFLRLVMENKGEDELSEKILQKVKTAKQNVLLRKKYMEYERQRAYDILLGEEQGIKKGIEQGAKKKADEAAIECLKDNVPIENVAKWMKLPVEHVKELAEQLEK